MAYAVIRVRGHSGVNQDIEDTMVLMRLNRINHCVILPETDSIKGMLNKTKDYVTYGEIDEETLARMIKFRGRLVGDKPVDDAVVKEGTQYSSIMAFARALCAGEVRYDAMKDVKPLFRLTPPRKGYEGNKRSFQNGGALGYRGKKINELIQRMM
ncbi:MAG: 50S ribosomal protein L30P [Methanomassiliicoccales archaeon PtaU1.Bin124]|nr:MAG: 50S ribosomal protein L30P [Methanomassiliicoccales archaeon PtaU1.Bin124]